jgi:hypothetical protein
MYKVIQHCANVSGSRFLKSSIVANFDGIVNAKGCQTIGDAQTGWSVYAPIADGDGGYYLACSVSVAR